MLPQKKTATCGFTFLFSVKVEAGVEWAGRQAREKWKEVYVGGRIFRVIIKV